MEYIPLLMNTEKICSRAALTLLLMQRFEENNTVISNSLTHFEITLERSSYGPRYSQHYTHDSRFEAEAFFWLGLYVDLFYNAQILIERLLCVILLPL